MDFVEGLPKSAFMDNIYKLHGMPESIVTDRDRIFTSRFWREIAAPTGTKLKMSSSHHPQTDRQSERVNQCLEAFLRCFTHAWPAKWAQWLSLAEYWYNTSMHSSLQGKSPFETLYGHSPRQFGISDADACSVPELSTWLQDRALMLRLLQQHLERVRVRMKNQADKKRSDRVFQVGDSVFMRLQPHVQSSVAPRAHHKLLFKFYGPFKILERIGPSAYRLQLPLHSKIHPVLHVSQLKKALGPHCQVQSDLPPVDSQLAIPVRVLQRRFRQAGERAVPQGLIQWSDQLESLATWEDLEALKQRFPRAAAWGQAAFQGKGNVKARPWATTGDSPTNEAQEVVRLDKRLRQPAQRYTSDEWVK
ncbi:hypothetical protein ACQJBY_009639 [Aegilops geniculata]